MNFIVAWKMFVARQSVLRFGGQTTDKADVNDKSDKIKFGILEAAANQFLSKKKCDHEDGTGLERIAEELMGSWKWKLYQDSMQQRNYLQPLNNNIKQNDKFATTTPPNSTTTTVKEELLQQHIADTKALLQKQQEKQQLCKEDTVEEGIERANGACDPSEEKNHAGFEQQENEGQNDDKVIDWSPTSKCIFCVDGKLDEHNNHGALSPRHSDSDSSDTPSDTETAPTLTPSATAASLLNSRRGMTALDTQMAMAAAALSGGAPGSGGVVGGGGVTGGSPHLSYYSPLNPNWILSQMTRNLHATAADGGRAMSIAAGLAAAAAAAALDGEKATATGGEQPLDLSSKAGSGNSTPTDNQRHAAVNMRLPTIDNKHIFKAKPRMSAVGGRRTYTEEELQAALRDIQSGKLGTRRAAVIYGIPRSTLRNKIVDEDEGMMDDEKELSGAEEEKEVEKALEAPLLSYDDLVNSDTLKAFLAKTIAGSAGSDGETFPSAEHSAFGPHLQTLLLRSLISQKVMDTGGGGVGGDSALPEVIKRLLAQELMGEQLKLQQQHQHHHHMQNNGDAATSLPARPSPSNSVVCRSTDKSKSESDMETEDSGSNVILKIPSFKPTSTSGVGSCGSKNGDYAVSLAAVSPSVTSDSTSPPILPGRGLFQKDVKDLIAKSISQKFQQSPEPLRNPIMDFDLKRGRFTPPLGGISVIKTQEPRGYPPPHHAPHHQHHQQPQTQKNQNSNSSGGSGGGGSGGKGTRPKRGKYRNYDRDSLVEAVRAVQRGEMSVHRAGSYYGVPHSTLEYKVKERHLMRPRKRDPKPNPVDEKIASLKRDDMRNAAAAAAAAAANEKLKAQQASIKPSQKFPPTSPNGMKLSIYDPTTLTPLGYNLQHQFPFWPHGAYQQFSLDYGRTPAAAAAAAAAAAFPPNPDQLYASQMIQKMHEESRTFMNSAASGTAANLSKSTRQMAESLLDPTESNGLLDGIIRSSLESGVPGDDKKEDRNVAPENMSNKALLDQLCRNSRFTPLIKCKEAPVSPPGERKDTPESDTSDREEDTKPNIHTIELSNDSHDGKTNNNSEENGKLECAPTPRPGMIFLKQELTKPENLKPEMLVRFRDSLPLHNESQRNGGGNDANASESEAAQD